MIANPNNNVQENKYITTYIPALSILGSICALYLLCCAIKEEDKYQEGFAGCGFALWTLLTAARIYLAWEEKKRVSLNIS